MKKKLKIAMISSECVPFAKTGGLADVVGSLPEALQALGHEVIVIIPKYNKIDAEKFGLVRFFHQLGVWMGNALEWCAVDRGKTKAGVPVFFIESHKYFGRDGIYHDSEMHDYQDNPQRFAFFTRAALQLCRDMWFSPDIIHCHDWQTALAPAYLKVWHWNDPVLGHTASMLTIHNIGYQGVYSSDSYEYIGLRERNFTSDKLEDHGRINFLKGGITYADIVNTVSPTYADETRTPEYAHGMAPYLNDKHEYYTGILNGVDYSQWNPEIDELIPAKYSIGNMAGKAQCKQALQKRLDLELDPTMPLVGVVSRFASQKGLDILAATMDDIARNMRVQFAILGSGDPELESFYGKLPTHYPGRMGSYIGYSNELAHWVEAGSDFFAMPSRYEPCGLNQIYSLKYGTLPIVRNTGGLADTVEQYDEATAGGTGFKFDALSAHAIYDTVGWAVSTWYDRPEHYQAMQKRAMQQHFAWDDSAKAYVEAYRKAIEHKKSLL